MRNWEKTASLQISPTTVKRCIKHYVDDKNGKIICSGLTLNKEKTPGVEKKAEHKGETWTFFWGPLNSETLGRRRVGHREGHMNNVP